MTNSDLTLSLRVLQIKLLARFRLECIYQINDKFKAYDIAKLLGISAPAFSNACTGVSTLSGPTFYKLICALIGLGVDVFNYFEMESYVLDFIKMSNPEKTGEIFHNTLSALVVEPPVSRDEAQA